jgi:hypothetical protein
MEANESPIRKVGIDQKDKSAGFRTRKGFSNTFAAGPNVKSYFDISWPYDVDLALGDYKIPAAANAANRLWIELAPNFDLAILAAPAAIQNAVAAGDTGVVLNPYAKAALDGLLASNGDVQTSEVYFRLTSIPGDPTDFTALRMAKWDSENSKLVSPTGAAFGLAAAAGDKIFITTRWEDGSYIFPGEYIRIGDESLGSSSLPAGVKIRVIVLNEDAAALTMYFNLVYYHS